MAAPDPRQQHKTGPNWNSKIPVNPRLSKSRSNSLDWDSDSTKTGTVKRRPISSEFGENQDVCHEGDAASFVENVRAGTAGGQTESRRIEVSQINRQYIFKGTLPKKSSRPEQNISSNEKLKTNIGNLIRKVKKHGATEECLKPRETIKNRPSDKFKLQTSLQGASECSDNNFRNLRDQTDKPKVIKYDSSLLKLSKCYTGKKLDEDMFPKNKNNTASFKTQSVGSFERFEATFLDDVGADENLFCGENYENHSFTNTTANCEILWNDNNHQCQTLTKCRTPNSLVNVNLSSKPGKLSDSDSGINSPLSPGSVYGVFYPKIGFVFASESCSKDLERDSDIRINTSCRSSCLDERIKV